VSALPSGGVSGNDRKDSGVGPKTLIVASLASVTSALVVSHIWGPGTLVGAAVTPIIVTLVSEVLQRPRRVITTVRPRASRRFDPVAEGRRGLDEGDLDAAWAVAAGEEPARSVHRARTRRVPRAAVRAALVTGLVAFVIAGLVLTGSELVFGGSAVSGADRRTTFFGGAGTPAKTKTTPDTKTTTGTTTTDTTTTGTTTTTDTTTTPTTTEPAPTTTTTAPPPVTTTAPAPEATPPPATTTPDPGATPPPSP
jgi:hypothetical protein